MHFRYYSSVTSVLSFHGYHRLEHTPDVFFQSYISSRHIYEVGVRLPILEPTSKSSRAHAVVTCCLHQSRFASGSKHIYGTSWRRGNQCGQQMSRWRSLRQPSSMVPVPAPCWGGQPTLSLPRWPLTLVRLVGGDQGQGKSARQTKRDRICMPYSASRHSTDVDAALSHPPAAWEGRRNRR